MLCARLQGDKSELPCIRLTVLMISNILHRPETLLLEHVLSLLQHALLGMHAVQKGHICSLVMSVPF